MENEAKKPIKRGQEIAPLSREHHDGLMMVLKIGKGIKNGVAIKRIADYLHWFWQQHLLPHFEKEEKYLQPILPADNALMQQMFTEHRQIQKGFENVNEVSSYTELEAIAKKVNDHIRFEERVLFNEIEKVATKEQLQQLAVQLNDEAVCEKWRDEFWL